ncbi:MAG: MerR family transcriptional regulator [Deltaproteobacteria bacterium]|nr:MAG: MerR family transcriptional regulator [Deltaproteobacteria bacterium]
MLRIGDFARLGGVTVRALRHYEAKGLLAPAQVDPATGYRSYRFDQLAALDRVLALRDLGFPLADVRALLASATDTAALVRRLGEQRARLAAELETQTARLRRLEALRAAIAGDPGAAGLSVRVRRIPDVRVLALRSRVRSEGEPMAALFEEAEARASRHRVDSSPFLIFHAPLDVEACVPVRSACALPGVRTVAGAPLAGSVTYSGSYAQTKSLRPRMIRWLERSGLRVSGPWREVYHRFGADQRGYRLPARRVATVSAQFVTELQVPAEEAR